MARIEFHKVSALPGTLVANAIYFVENGSYAESYITNAAGIARSIGNSTMINTLADARIAVALADRNLIEIVADIPARNALATGAQRNLLVLVENATGDATVASGAALYSWKEAGATWTKITEYESVDVVLNWANIQGRPTSSPTQIDNAVNNSHVHTNKVQLDKIGEASGAMTYNGEPVGSNLVTNNW